MGNLCRNFSVSEFACPCCGESKMNPFTIERLQRVRNHYSSPIQVAKGGGYRCKNYDDSNGAHPLGQAIDPIIPKGHLFRFIRIAMNKGFTGIGVKNIGGKWQLHIDDAIDIPNVRPRPWVWTY